MLQFWSILEATWLCFGRVLGDKMGPRWHQMVPKIDSKIYTKNDHLFDHPRIDFLRILDPKLVPHRGNQPSHFRCFFDHGAFLAPKAPQRPHPRRLLEPPRPFPEPSCDRLLTILGSNSMVFETSWPIFHLQLGGFYSQPTSQTANQPTNQPAKESIHPDIPSSQARGRVGRRQLDPPPGLWPDSGVSLMHMPAGHLYSCTLVLEDPGGIL